MVVGGRFKREMKELGMSGRRIMGVRFKVGVDLRKNSEEDGGLGGWGRRVGGDREGFVGYRVDCGFYVGVGGF